MDIDFAVGGENGSNSAGARATSTQLLTGILAILVAEREEHDSNDAITRRKSEVVLADAGFSIVDIARITGRKYQAVRSVLRRERGKNVATARGSKGG